MSASILLRRAGAVATVTLNRPDRRNALDLEMWGALAEAMRTVSADDTVRCVVMTGAGGAFAAGADIAEFAARRRTGADARTYGEVVNQALGALRDCPAPTVAAVRGPCVGGGLQIAILCDLRIAAASSTFGAPVQRLGFAMPYPEIAYLVDTVGRAAALEILLEGRVFGADEALRKGLVSRVVADEALDGELAAAVARIIEGAPLAARAHKRLVRRALDPKPWNEAEIEESFALADTEDYRRGVEAFLSKRKPVFEGR
jgi:enoyl-CoA hydratase/carnithine racemase